MELIDGKSLQELLEEFSSLACDQEKIITTIRSILKTLNYLASQGLMHRDLKPDNILVDSSTGEIKIIDFGLAAKYNEKKLIYKRCGSPGFIAPEVFQYTSSDPTTSYNDRVDIFSLG